ncbi:MAG: hypothetical protein J1E39_07980 [Eubacterium sp.]|nr:hypothetical protein [Eubacterium sp.]
MSLYETLRQKHKEFIYHSYTIDEDGFSFHFSIGEYEFHPSWKYDKGSLENISPLGEYIIFNIGMAELVSYWKCACPPVVRVNCGSLTAEQCRWWKKLYFNGLGEFFYRNKINADFEDFMTIIPQSDAAPDAKIDKPLSGFLVPVGGGKDSVVSLELLRQYHDDTLCYIINPRGATVKCANAAGFDDSGIVGVRRTIDKELLARNADGYLNGHTPFSAVVAFSAYLFAYLNGKKYIALSNESSANETYVKGKNVNHQYSKSTEFERDFREYTDQYLGGSDGTEYFSLLRPLSEYRIASIFVRYKQYFPVFQSCNLGSKTDSWCANCAKCLYVYILLAAFLDDETLTGIFGRNMLEDEKLSEIFDGLIYEDIDKPFECVGTKSEVRYALYQAAQLRTEKMPVLLDGYIKKYPDRPADAEDIENYFDSENYVPRQLLQLVKQAL